MNHGRLSGAAACEQRISATPTPRPVPALQTHVDHMRSVLVAGHEAAGRAELALDRLIGLEPVDAAKGTGVKESPSCYEREMQSLGESAEALLNRVTRIAQRLDSAV